MAPYTEQEGVNLSEVEGTMNYGGLTKEEILKKIESLILKNKIKQEQVKKRKEKDKIRKKIADKSRKINKKK